MSATVLDLSFEEQVAFGRWFFMLLDHPLRLRDGGVLTDEACYAAALADHDLACHHPATFRRWLKPSVWECGVCRTAFACLTTRAERLVLGAPGSPVTEQR